MKIKIIIFLCILTSFPYYRPIDSLEKPEFLLTADQIRHFESLVNILPKSARRKEAREIIITLQHLLSLTKANKISLAELITKLKQLIQKIETTPSLKNIQFASPLYGTITLSQFGATLLRTFIQDLEKNISFPLLTDEEIAEFQQLIYALEGPGIPPIVTKIKNNLSNLFTLVRNNKELITKLNELAFELETNPEYISTQFNSVLFGPITLNQFSMIILRNFIDELEQKLVLSLSFEQEPPLQPVRLQDPAKSFAQPSTISPQPPATRSASPKTIQTVPHGLSNIGNSCFMNASLQSIYAMDQLTDELLKRIGMYKPNTFGREYINFINQLRTSTQKVIEPRALCMAGWATMHFAPLSQQDNDEFIVTLLSELIPDIDKDPLAQVIAITLQQYLNNNPSSTEKTFLLSLPIPLTESTLDGCLKTFFGVEKVTMQEGGKEVLKDKQLKITKTGQYLIIHLKRNIPKIDPRTNQVIIDSRNQIEMEKITKPITFSLENLNLNPYAIPGVSLPFYRLKAMVIHSGSAYGGHYTAYVRYGNQWYFVNDTQVSPVSAQEIAQIATRGYGSDKGQTPTTFFYEAQQ